MVNGYIDFNKQKLPQSYKRQGKDCYLDPIREKLIYITPEETVRQQVVSYLMNVLEVPANMIDVELHLSCFTLRGLTPWSCTVYQKYKTIKPQKTTKLLT